MAISLVLLSFCAVILIFLIPRSRYGLSLFFMIIGMILSTATVLFQYYSSSSYTPPTFFPLRSVDIFLYRYIGGKFRSPMPYMQQIRNIGVIIYLLGTALFTRVIKRNLRLEGVKHHKLKWLFILLAYLTLFGAYLKFYSPSSAYHLYLYYHSCSAKQQDFLRFLLNTLHNTFNGLILLYIFYPLMYLLFQYFKKKITFFTRTIIIIFFYLTIINLQFFITFFVGTFKYKSSDVFEKAFWFFNEITKIPQIYIITYPIFSIAVLLFLLLNINRFFSIDLFFLSTEKALTKSIDELNQNLKDVFHSEKNLMFSINILANEAKNEYGNEKGLAKLNRIIDISLEQMTTISESLNRIKELHIKTTVLDLRDLTDTAINNAHISETIHIEKKYCSFPALCSVDMYHTSHAIINLLLNSKDALEMSEQNDKKIVISIDASKEWVYLSIWDNGIGMEKKSIKKMLMPFVSTKSKTGNWGIGLPYVFRVLNAHLGQLQIKSSKKKHKHFTNIEVLLPRYRRNEYEKDNNPCC